MQELVARGRYPHQPLFTRWRKEDEEAVTKAMQATGITHLADQSVDTLSGWATPASVDRDGAGPGNGNYAARRTHYLAWYISHQIDSLERLSQLNREEGYTLVAVLHDLNQACRYASHLIALREGKIVAQGAPKEIVTAELIERIYGLRRTIVSDHRKPAMPPQLAPATERHLQPQRVKLSGLPSWHPVFWMPSHSAITRYHKPPSRRSARKD